MYNLSEKAIAEKYEDLLFTKVMALYAAEESEKILSEIENEEPADPKNIEKIYSKTERRENFSTLWKVSKKLITFAAMVVFVAVVSLSSVVVASAEAREAVAEAIYHLVLRKTDRYTEVSIGNSTGFIDPELYNWEGAYAPTYMPKEYILKEKSEMPNRKSVTYINGEKYVAISQSVDGVFQIDTEDADIYKKISINESDAVYVENKGFVFIVWSIGEKTFSVRGTINPEEALKIAESLKPIEKYEAPAEEYEFVDPEIYDWEGAYAPTYIPEGFVFSEKQELTTRAIITYSNGEKYFSITQSNQTSNLHMDTQNAQKIEAIKINDSAGLLVEKNGFSSLAWNDGSNFFWLRGETDSAELIKVAEGLKPLGKTETEEPAEEYEFIDAEVFNWEGAYAPTYIPEGFVFSEKQELPSKTMIVYSREKEHFIISQATSGITRVDTENAQVVKNILIGDSEALYVEKNNFTYIVWMSGDVCLSVTGKISSDEAVKIAEGIKPIGKTEEPAEEYEFVDPEIYTWDNAYGLTYVTENYDFYSVKDLEISRIVNYMQGEKYISFVQYTDTTVATDTEDADITKEIQIGESKGFLVVKDDWSCVFYSVEDILLQVSGTAPTEEIIKIAEGIKPIN